MLLCTAERLGVRKVENRPFKAALLFATSVRDSSSLENKQALTVESVRRGANRIRMEGSGHWATEEHRSCFSGSGCTSLSVEGKCYDVTPAQGSGPSFSISHIARAAY